MHAQQATALLALLSVGLSPILALGVIPALDLDGIKIPLDSERYGKSKSIATSTKDTSTKDTSTKEEWEVAFDVWKVNMKKTYTLDKLQEAKETFQPKYDEMVQHNAKYNAGLEKYRLKLTPYAADADEDEKFKKTGNRNKEVVDSAQGAPLRSLTLQNESPGRRLTDSSPSTDWEPWLPPVHDQAPCESCWAFVASATIAGSFHYARRTAPQRWLSNREHSAQQLQDCDAGWPTSGGGVSCNLGGSYLNAFEWIAAHGVALNSTHNYLGRDAPCNMNNMRTGLSCSRNGQVANGCGTTADNPYFCPYASQLTNAAYISELKRMLTLAPVAIGIHSCALPSGYADGIIPSSRATNCGSGPGDHAVTLVGWGYDATLRMSYWKIRNSWGGFWGENGYARIERTANFAGIKSSDPCIPLGAQFYSSISG